MWTKPLQNGGVVGGNPFDNSIGVGYFEGSAYNNRFTNPIILDGYLYYTAPVAFTGGTTGVTYCVNLQTGEVLWTSNQIPALSFGYIYNLWNGNQHGVYPPILFTANFARAFDAWTGDPLFNVTGVPTGTVAAGPNGEQLRYVLTNTGTSTNPAWYLSEWNSSRMWATYSNPITGLNVNSPTLYNYSYTNGTTLSNADAQYANVAQPTLTMPAGKDPNQPAVSNYVVYANVVNKSSSIYSYDWNISIPYLNTLTSTTGVLNAYCGDMLLCYNASQTAVLAGSSVPSFGGTGPLPTPSVPYTYFAINLNASKGTVGSILWTNTLQPPAGNITAVYAGTDPVGRVFLEEYKQTMQYVAYNLNTGAKLWGPSTPQTALDYYGNQFSGGMMGQLAYGKLYSIGFAGIMYCRDEQTGNLLWTYGNGGEGNSTYAGFYTNYGDYPTFVSAITNGIIYLETTEHTILDPIYKGALARAINATDGTEIWTLSDYTGGGGSSTCNAIADGYATFFNGYDNQIYVLGRGPSATTVTAPNTGLSFGQPMVIQGTVTDISAGTQQTQPKADFPQGVPVASDASMKDWMGYIYQQKPLPTNFTGVPVTIDVFDSNGNYRTIGTATTDATGTYHLTWTPDIPGDYAVIASFAGTKGYWPSSAEANFVVMNAAPTVSPYPVTILPPTGMYIAAAATVTIIAMAIGIAVAILVLRKRP
jgi:outer membrane protein assembly factor BamB